MNQPLKMQDITPAIYRVMKSRDGKLMMQWLEATFYDSKLNSDNLEREVGQRDVVRQIKIMADTPPPKEGE